MSLGAQAQARICAPPAQALGQCDNVYLKEIGDTQVFYLLKNLLNILNFEVVIFDKKGESGRIATIIVRGSSQSLLDDMERAIDDAVNTYKALTRNNKVLSFEFKATPTD